MDVDALRRAVTDKYEEVARSAEGRFSYPVGRASLRRLGYADAWLDGIPDALIDRFVGVGNPFPIADLRPGERVLDVGCGCGLDVLVAARMVGPDGHATGLDLTRAMVQRARDAATGNVSFDIGDVEALPYADDAFDAVLSNGALNLAPGKERAFAEIARVLRPGGRFVAADLLVVDSVPEETLRSLDAWST